MTAFPESKSTVADTTPGTFLIAFATNGLEILGIGAFIKPIFNGAVLVGAVALTTQLRRRRLGRGAGRDQIAQ